MLEIFFVLVLAISKGRCFIDPTQHESIRMCGPERAPHYSVVLHLYLKKKNRTTEKNEKDKKQITSPSFCS